jgi:predicted DCC family thiol-disulfide oxidoreductase YuxK
MSENAVILYDGVCHLCTWTVRFILKRDAAGYFKFVSQQSDAGQNYLAWHGFEPGSMYSIILVEGSQYLIKSTAALRIARHLPGLWPILSFFVFIPQPLRDWFYDLIARYRYRWFGKNDVCLIPAEGNIKRFLN